MGRCRRSSACAGDKDEFALEDLKISRSWDDVDVVRLNEETV